MPRSDDRVAALAERYSAEAEGYLAVYSPHLLPFQRELLALVDLTRAARILDLGNGPGTAIPFIRAACIEAVTERTRGLPASDLGLDAEVLFAVATR